MKISESIKILLEYKAVSDSDTNQQYDHRAYDSAYKTTLTDEQRAKYLKHLDLTHPNAAAARDAKINDESDEDNQNRIRNAISLDRANIAKHNDELYDNHITPAAALVKRISKAASEHSGGIAAGAAIGLLGGHLLSKRNDKNQ